MSKATHMLAMAGMALVAGAAFGASPAAAAPAAPEATTAATSSAAYAQSQAGDRFGGFYRTRRSCERAGRAGQFLGRWNSYDCDPVLWGPRHGWWILNVNDRWHGDNHGGHGGHHHGGGHGHHHHHGRR